MVMFLASDLSNMIRALMRKFIQDGVLVAASTDDKLLKIDVAEKTNHKTYKQIDLGFSTEKELKEVRAYPHECCDLSIIKTVEKGRV